MSYRDLLAEAAARRNAEQALAKAEFKLARLEKLIAWAESFPHTGELHVDEIRKVLESDA